MSETPLTDREILTHLHAAGVRAGDVLIVHSSLKSIGPVAGGPAAVVAALIDAVGPTGTVLMPTFADPQPDGKFRVATMPSRTGAITEAFRTTAGAVRSHHPTHAVSAWGARAAELTAGHESTSGLGVGSPFHQAAVAGAKVLMIGCDCRSCSVIHVAEAIAKTPYLGRVWYDGYDRALTLVSPQGRETVVPPRDPPGCSAGFTAVQSSLERDALLHRVRIGRAETLLFSAVDALAAAASLLAADPAAPLCASSRCPVCTKARAIVAGG